MQKKKNILLLVALLITLAIIFIIPLLNKGNNSLTINKRQFTLDQQTIITDVILHSSSFQNKLSFVNGRWTVNNRFELDPNMRDVFFSVLSQMEIRRPVAQSLLDSISDQLSTNGVHVTILNNEDTIKSYLILGNKETQTSYISDSHGGSPFQLFIPGYRSYVAGIFRVPELDWRSRRVFSALFTNLNSLELAYDTGDTITYSYKNSFFEIEGIQADSSQLITSLENLLFLQTDQFLMPTESLYYVDSNLLPKIPFASITTTQLSGNESTLRLFNPSTKGENYLGITPDSVYCLFNKKRLDDILVKKEDFN